MYILLNLFLITVLVMCYREMANLRCAGRQAWRYKNGEQRRADKFENQVAILEEKVQSSRQRTKYYLGLVNWLRRTTWNDSPAHIGMFMQECSLHGALDYYEKCRFSHWPVGSGKRTTLHRETNKWDYLSDR
ncbi:MAG: hypothetical protein GY934_09000 [Gammaproteobacteria bacterium]|nr:hypothetical protein [Gammaproteobacteria bacterium]